VDTTTRQPIHSRSAVRHIHELRDEDRRCPPSDRLARQCEWSDLLCQLPICSRTSGWRRDGQAR